jgi:type II secretory pathway pseudopilin PulG
MRTSAEAALRRFLCGPRGFTLVEVAASVAILGGMILGILVARNNALEAHARADQILSCTRLCAGQVAALRAGCVGAGQGWLVAPSGTYEWRITVSAPPEDSTATALAPYNVAVWPAPVAATSKLAGDDAMGDLESPPPADQPDEQYAASVILWLPAKPGAAGGRGTP